MSIEKLKAHNSGRAEKQGIPIEGLKKVMENDSEGVASRGVGGAKKTLYEAIKDFDTASETIFQASDKLHASADELAKRAKISVSRAKDTAHQMSDAMHRMTKLLGPDFEERIIQLERLADAMERLNALHKNGQLADVIKAISK